MRLRLRYYGNDDFIFGWDLSVIFFRHTDLVIDGVFFKKLFFNFDLKGVIEICVGCFLVHLFLGFFSLKNGVCVIS